MTTPTTNYLVRNPNNGDYQDLGQLFQLRRNPTTDPSANLTGFTYIDLNGNQLDLSTLFYPLTTGPQLLYNTNMISLNGKDLTDVFRAATIFEYINVDGLYTYSYDASTNYFTVVFADYTTSDPMSNPSAIGNSSSSATLTFKISVNNVRFTLVGGGGGGGGTEGGSFNGGGGGQGGGYSSYFISNTTGTYNIQVGGGGAGGSYNQTSTPGTDTTVTQSSGLLYRAEGGVGGGAALSNSAGGTGGGVSGTPGAGGNGGAYKKYPSQPGTDGNNIQILSGSTSYYFGGGGAGGKPAYPTINTPVEQPGGQGGGGGTSANGGNDALAYTGPNSIYYPVGSFPNTGWPATGGGGSGGNGNTRTYEFGNAGASGIVIVTFQNA